MKKRKLFDYPLCHSHYFKTLAIVVGLLLNVFPLKAQYAFSETKKNLQVTASQHVNEDKLTLDFKNEKLGLVFDKIEKKTGLVFVYANDEVDINQKVSLNVSDKAAAEVFKQLLNPLGINFSIVKDKIILQSSKQKIPLPGGSNSNNTTPDRSVAANLQNTISISGRVTDENGKGLGLVTVLLKGSTTGTSTNAEGNFTLNIADDKSKGILVFSSVGFVTQEVAIAGKTINQASEDLTKIIDKDYIISPEVVIEILGYKLETFVILGQVQKPGTFNMPSGPQSFTFLQAVSMAGGFSQVANIKKVKIIRQVDGQRKILRINAESIISGQDEDIKIEPGDVIHVSESLF